MRHGTQQNEAQRVAVASLLLEMLPPFMMELRQELSRQKNSPVTMPQFRVLSQLHCFGPANNKAIAENLGVTVANSSRMIDLLVKKKLVLRAQGLKDKREILVRLSPEGQKYFQQVQEKLRKCVAGRFELNSEEELSSMNEGLSLLRSALGQEEAVTARPARRGLPQAGFHA